jgi:hypothetical protein
LLKVTVLTLGFCVCFPCGNTAAQTSGAGAGTSTGYQPSSALAGAGAPGGVPSVGLQQNTFTGSVPEGKATAEILALSFADAIQGGLRQNLGALLAGENTLAVRGEKWKELSDLLPNVTTSTRKPFKSSLSQPSVLGFQVFRGS